MQKMESVAAPMTNRSRLSCHALRHDISLLHHGVEEDFTETDRRRFHGCRAQLISTCDEGVGVLAGDDRDLPAVRARLAGIVGRQIERRRIAAANPNVIRRYSSRMRSRGASTTRRPVSITQT